MFKPGGAIFLHAPQSSVEQILHQGIVNEASRERIVATFSERIFPVVGSNVLLHCEVNRKFMQQGGAVAAFLAAEPNPVIAFDLCGEPISAEHRAVYRVSVAASENVWASLDERVERCPVHDLSAAGFGLLSRHQYRIGDVVLVRLQFNGSSYGGQARVQSIRARTDGRFRYGMHAMQNRGGKSKDSLTNGLGQISAAVQREQLRRLARA